MTIKKRLVDGVERLGQVMLVSLLLLSSFVFLPGIAFSTTEALAPELESRYRVLLSELRCPVCQNQSLADSKSGLALDLKREIRARIDSGESDKQVIGFLTDRYGDFVLYRPPVKLTTILLWFGPLLLAVAAVIMLVRNVDVMRRSNPAIETGGIDRMRAARLLGRASSNADFSNRRP